MDLYLNLLAGAMGIGLVVVAAGGFLTLLEDHPKLRRAIGFAIGAALLWLVLQDVWRVVAADPAGMLHIASIGVALPLILHWLTRKKVQN